MVIGARVLQKPDDQIREGGAALSVWWRPALRLSQGQRILERRYSRETVLARERVLHVAKSRCRRRAPGNARRKRARAGSSWARSAFEPALRFDLQTLEGGRRREHSAHGDFQAYRVGQT